MPIIKVVCFVRTAGFICSPATEETINKKFNTFNSLFLSQSLRGIRSWFIIWICFRCFSFYSQKPNKSGFKTCVTKAASHLCKSIIFGKCEKSNQEKHEVEETDEGQASPGRPCNRLHLGSLVQHWVSLWAESRDARWPRLSLIQQDRIRTSTITHSQCCF